jgi:hypothetical protein
MFRLDSAALKIKAVRRVVLDVRRCERHPLLQRFHERWRVARYERDIERLPSITDVFVISFPKSGRTWHRFLLGNYLADLWGRSQFEAASVEKLTEARVGTRVRYDHNGANFADAIPPQHPIVADPRLWRGRKVIFLAREPKDVLVSAWHHAHYRQSSFSGSIAELVRSPYAGIDKLLTAHNRWWDHREQAASYLVTSYERMHADLGGVLRDTLEFVGWPVDEAAIARAVAASSFASMREVEAKSAIEHKSLRAHSGTRDQSDDRSRKVRSGKVGGHREHMADADIAHIDARVATLGNPFATYSAPAQVSPAV